ncbi:MAG: Nramp family divalent metal transporter [Planctomycetaceae bacterium]
MTDTTRSTEIKPLAPGQLPAWEVAELPEPLPFSFRNAFKVIGPGAIMLAASIGGGEWLIGPATVIKHGPGVLWIATVAIVLQLIFNLEGIRYTLYTGEPAISGIMRLKPGCRFWGGAYVLLTAMQLGVPALAPAAAVTVFGMIRDRVPVSAPSDQEWQDVAHAGAVAAEAMLHDQQQTATADNGFNLKITYGIIVVTLLMLMFGGTIERMLEWSSWFMIAYIFLFLIAVNVWFVPSTQWLVTLRGFVSFGEWPKGIEPLLMATFFATAGSGGIGNLTISNWIRDKGFGMGAVVGAIPSAVGAKEIRLSHVGKVFAITADNLRRWRIWWRYVMLDQMWVWALGCFCGMFLNVNLAQAIIAPGTDLSKIGAGAFQAQYMRDHFWSALWILGLLNGFWILFSTQLGNTDVLIRTLTDTLWTASSRVRSWRDGSIAKVYYSLLAVFTVWGLIAVHLGSAMTLFKYLGTMAGVVMAIASVQLYLVNTRLLPRELQPSWWRKGALLLCSAAYGTMSLIAGYDVVRKWFG